jgi:hypothetical protein
MGQPTRRGYPCSSAIDSGASDNQPSPRVGLPSDRQDSPCLRSVVCRARWRAATWASTGCSGYLPPPGIRSSRLHPYDTHPDPRSPDCTRRSTPTSWRPGPATPTPRHCGAGRGVADCKRPVSGCRSNLLRKRRWGTHHAGLSERPAPPTGCRPACICDPGMGTRIGAGRSQDEHDGESIDVDVPVQRADNQWIQF